MRWDAGASVGVMQHFMTGAAPGAATPLPGPFGEIRAHLALLPMLRVGPYLLQDVAFLSGAPAREITQAGLRAKLSPPLFALPWRTWAFLGVGYARAYEPSHHLAGSGDFVPGQGGGSLDTRVGVGLGYRVEKTVELFAELGGQFGLFYTGSMYDQNGCDCAQPFQGKDSFALSLSLGLSLYP